MFAAYKAYKIDWTESERGWGTRPDGTTLHKDKETADQYILDYWKREGERNPTGAVPDEYTRPDKPELCAVNKEQYDKLQVEGSFWITMSNWWRGNL